MTSTDTMKASLSTSTKAHTAAIRGQTATTVGVTARIEPGLPSFDVTGLREPAVRELRVRVRGAIGHAGFGFPVGRVTLAFDSPSPVDDTAHDLAAAISILGAAGHLGDAHLAPQSLAFFAELSLSGHLRPCRAALPAAVAARKAGLTAIVVATDNLVEASLSGLTVYAASNLNEVIDHVSGKKSLQSLANVDATLELASSVRKNDHQPDFVDVRGLPDAVRAMEVAAAGGHHTLLIGGPGAGKTMLARRLPSILPPLTVDEALKVTTLASIAGLNIGGGMVSRRPFRAPHHSTTAAGLVGGGAPVARPGELSLAHHGVLFLDELPEFPRQTLEYLREPLRSGLVELSRAAGTVTYDGRAQVVAAMNPCPCGMLGHPRMRCRCTTAEVAHYRGRITDHFMANFAIKVTIPAIDLSTLGEAQPGESSAVIRERVILAQKRQLDRAGKLNAALTPGELGRLSVDPAGKALIQSALATNRVRNQPALLAVARTVADLAGAEVISSEHLSEALTWQ